MWEIARKNQRKSAFLLIIMSIILIGLGYLIGMYIDPNDGGITGILIASAVYFILLFIALSQGTAIILKMSNAKEVKHKDNPQLYNIVDEMRIAAGMEVMPKVFIIEDPAPNAFAAGMTPKKSIVAVTRGLLDMMNRDELQGVIAHEISHIINRDIRYLTIATIMVASVALISQIFLRSMFFRGSRGGKNGKGQAIIMIVAIVFAILAPIAIRMLYFALSRKREYLADASGARLTRYPEGLASALEKIGGSTVNLESANKTTAPMYIANPLKPKGAKLKNLTSTHPPLQDRIKILRSMGNTSSLTDYQQAYQSVSGKRAGFIPTK
ncbi:MAG: M48 family metallopeptidase [Bacteroidales bacterium]